MIQRYKKGRKGEYEWRDFLKDGELEAARVPCSGGGGIAGDVIVTFSSGRKEQHEVKRRASAWSTIYNWLAGNDALALRADDKGWIVVVTGERYRELLAKEDEWEEMINLKGGN